MNVLSILNKGMVYLHLIWLRRKMQICKPDTLVRCADYRVRINDGSNFYILYKDIFIHRIYHFEAKFLKPLILDCGSNIGISILYSKYIYPKARIIGFEPDPAIFAYLKENVTRNKLTDVKLIQAALANQEGALNFYSDVKRASSLAKHISGGIPQGRRKFDVSCVRLRDYLVEPVDFLKMNIEGAEWEVLFDSADRLRQVQEMVIEYHYLPNLPVTLHKILELLDYYGFKYIINDFDFETNPGVSPPFRLTKETGYFLLIYAKRID